MPRSALVGLFGILFAILGLLCVLLWRQGQRDGQSSTPPGDIAAQADAAAKASVELEPLHQQGECWGYQDGGYWGTMKPNPDGRPWFPEHVTQGWRICCIEDGMKNCREPVLAR